MLAIGLTHGQLHQIGHVRTAAMVAAATFTFSAWLGSLAVMYIHLAVNEGLSRLSEVNGLRFWLGVSDTGIPLSTLPRNTASALAHAACGEAQRPFGVVAYRTARLTGGMADATCRGGTANPR
jgi:hypothetical protein